MDEYEVIGMLEELLGFASDIEQAEENDVYPPEWMQDSHTCSFEQAGVLTMDKGIVLTTGDGQKIYITIQVE